MVAYTKPQQKEESMFGRRMSSVIAIVVMIAIRTIITLIKTFMCSHIEREDRCTAR